MADPPGFLARWSRLKQQSRQPTAPEADVPGEPAPELPATELPSIETLTAESDFTAFMQPGVPEPLRNAALQKLWRSDPVYANLDGLVEYGEDYAADFRAATAVATVYRVLQGMPDREEQPPPEPPPPTLETPSDGAPPPAETETRQAEPPAAARGRRSVTDQIG